MLYTLFQLFLLLSVFGLAAANGPKQYNVRVGTLGQAYEVPPGATNYVCAVFDTQYLPAGEEELYISKVVNQYDPEEVHHFVLYAVKKGHPYAELEHGSVLPNCFPEKTDPTRGEPRADIIWAAQHGNEAERDTPLGRGIPVKSENVQYKRFLFQAHVHNEAAHTGGHAARARAPTRSEEMEMETKRVNFGANLRLVNSVPVNGTAGLTLAITYPHQVILGSAFQQSTTRLTVPRNGMEEGAYCFGRHILAQDAAGVNNAAIRVGTQEFLLIDHGASVLNGIPVLAVGIHFHEYGVMGILRRCPATGGPCEVLDVYHAHGDHSSMTGGMGSGGMDGGDHMADNYHLKDGSQKIYAGDRIELDCVYNYTGVDTGSFYFEGGEDSFRQMCIAFIFTGNNGYAATTRLSAPDLVCNHATFKPDGSIDKCGKVDSNPLNDDPDDSENPVNSDSIATTWNLWRRSEAVIPYGCSKFDDETDQCLDCDSEGENCVPRAPSIYDGCIDYARVPPTVPMYDHEHGGHSMN